MAENQIAKTSHRHVAIAEFLVAHPTMKKSEVAEAFGVTQPWLSVIIHSDAFQAMLAEKQAEAYRYLIAPLAEKMSHLAHRAVDKLTEQVEVSSDVGVLLEVGRFATDRITWDGKPLAQQAGGVTVNVMQPVVAEILREAQQRARESRRLEHRSDEIEVDDSGTHSPAPPRLLTGGAD